ncbi:MAG TPA: hypothetical protein VEU28_00790 [Actinomycetota bacterium]|nr:hypothetical protein [Actinomycetota bacterium]
MATGARTPEELETLLEDTLVLRDYEALSELFEQWAVLAVDGAPSRLVGTAPIDAFGSGGSGDGYLAEPLLVIQARDIALVVTVLGANVVRRGADGCWRYAIFHIRNQASTERSAV